MATVINNPDTGSRDSNNSTLVLAIVIIALIVIAFLVYGFRGSYRTTTIPGNNAPATTNNSSGQSGNSQSSGSALSGQGSISGQGTINYTK